MAQSETDHLSKFKTLASDVAKIFLGETALDVATEQGTRTIYHTAMLYQECKTRNIHVDKTLYEYVQSCLLTISSKSPINANGNPKINACNPKPKLARKHEILQIWSDDIQKAKKLEDLASTDQYFAIFLLFQLIAEAKYKPEYTQNAETSKFLATKTLPASPTDMLTLRFAIPGRSVVKDIDTLINECISAKDDKTKLEYVAFITQAMMNSKWYLPPQFSTLDSIAQTYQTLCGQVGLKQHPMDLLVSWLNDVVSIILKDIIKVIYELKRNVKPFPVLRREGLKRTLENYDNDKYAKYPEWDLQLLLTTLNGHNGLKGSLKNDVQEHLNMLNDYINKKRTRQEIDNLIAIIAVFLNTNSSKLAPFLQNVTLYPTIKYCIGRNTTTNPIPIVFETADNTPPPSNSQVLIPGFSAVTKHNIEPIQATISWTDPNNRLTVVYHKYTNPTYFKFRNETIFSCIEPKIENFDKPFGICHGDQLGFITDPKYGPSECDLIYTVQGTLKTPFCIQHVSGHYTLEQVHVWLQKFNPNDGDVMKLKAKCLNLLQNTLRPAQAPAPTQKGGKASAKYTKTTQIYTGRDGVKRTVYVKGATRYVKKKASNATTFRYVPIKTTKK